MVSNHLPCCSSLKLTFRFVLHTNNNMTTEKSKYQWHIQLQSIIQTITNEENLGKNGRCFILLETNRWRCVRYQSQTPRLSTFTWKLSCWGYCEYLNYSFSVLLLYSYFCTIIPNLLPRQIYMIFTRALTSSYCPWNRKHIKWMEHSAAKLVSSNLQFYHDSFPSANGLRTALPYFWKDSVLDY